MEIINLKKAAFKKLSAVEIDKFMSNQHEFNGVSALKALFGHGRFSSNAKVYYINSQLDVKSSVIDITWYDARECHPTRSEYRLYYSGSPINNVKINDILIVLETTYGQYILLIVDVFSKVGQIITKKYYIGNYSIVTKVEDLEFLRILYGISDNNSNISTFEEVLMAFKLPNYYT